MNSEPFHDVERLLEKKIGARHVAAPNCLKTEEKLNKVKTNFAHLGLKIKCQKFAFRILLPAFRQ